MYKTRIYLKISVYINVAVIFSFTLTFQPQINTANHYFVRKFDILVELKKKKSIT